MTAASGRGAGADVRIDARALAACFVLVLTPVTKVLAVVDDRQGRDYAQHTLVFALDIALAVLVVQQALCLPAIVRDWRRHLAGVGALVLAIFLVPALVAHPTDRAVAALLRLLGVAALATVLVQLGRLERRLVLSVAAAVLAAASVVAVLQRATGGPVGLSALGEDGAGVLDIGGGLAPFGLFVHPYVLAAWATVAGLGLLGFALGRRADLRPPTVLVVAGVAPIGLTMCRSAVVATVLAGLGLVALAVLAVRDGERRRPILLLGAAGAVVLAGVLWNLGGWQGRAQTTVSSGDPTALRGSLLDQARGLLDADPVLGVGPGNYVLALYDRPDLQALNPQAPRPVHNVPILLLVEGGWIATPGILALIGAAVVQAWRGRATGWVLLGAFAPFLLLDHLAWSFPQGLVLSGLWLGLLDLAAERVSEPPPAPA